MFDDCAAEAIVEDMIFKCADNVDTSGKEFEGSGVHRFNPARINQGHGNAFIPEKTPSFLCKGEHISEPEKCDIAAMLDYLGLPDLKQFWLRLRLCAGAGSSGIADGNRTLMVVCHCPQHVHKLFFIFWLHMDHVRDVPQIADIKETVVGWPVITRKPRAIHAERHIQILQCNIVNEHIVC